jgi:transposase
LPDTVTILSCYEAGRDGFWLDRYLHAQGIVNLVVDSASIEVSRRSKRAKTDMLDVDKFLIKSRPHKSGYDCPLTLQLIGRRYVDAIRSTIIG